MNIDRFYRDSAKISLNGSIAALIPAILLVIVNIFIFEKDILMFLATPFIFYSIVLFQIYRVRYKYYVTCNQRLLQQANSERSLLTDSHFLIQSLNTGSATLFLYCPDGSLAGTMSTVRSKEGFFLKKANEFILKGANDEVVARYVVKGKSQTRIEIEVYDEEDTYLGILEKVSEMSLFKQAKKEVVDSTGKVTGTVEGSRMFMDEVLVNQNNQQIGRLRRGWMPLDWSDLFPDANTPVFSLSNCLSERERWLHFSLLVDQYFIERWE